MIVIIIIITIPLAGLTLQLEEYLFERVISYRYIILKTCKECL